MQQQHQFAKILPPVLLVGDTRSLQIPYQYHHIDDDEPPTHDVSTNDFVNHVLTEVLAPQLLSFNSNNARKTANMHWQTYDTFGEGDVIERTELKRLKFYLQITPPSAYVHLFLSVTYTKVIKIVDGETIDSVLNLLVGHLDENIPTNRESISGLIPETDIDQALIHLSEFSGTPRSVFVVAFIQGISASLRDLSLLKKATSCALKEPQSETTSRAINTVFRLGFGRFYINPSPVRFKIRMVVEVCRHIGNSSDFFEHNLLTVGVAGLRSNMRNCESDRNAFYMALLHVIHTTLRPPPPLPTTPLLNDDCDDDKTSNLRPAFIRQLMGQPHQGFALTQALAFGLGARSSNACARNSPVRMLVDDLVYLILTALCKVT